jgi:hypothetical protein
VTQDRVEAASGSPSPSLTFHMRLLLALLVSAVAAAQLMHLVTWSPSQIAAHGIFFDDAYFYSVLADNYGKVGFRSRWRRPSRAGTRLGTWLSPHGSSMCSSAS